MKKKEPIFEIIVNGKVTEEIKGWDQLDEVDNLYSDVLKKDAYEEIIYSTNGSQGYRLLFNKETLTTSTFAWREFTGFLDMNGNRVYKGDMLYSPEDGEKFNLNEYPETTEKRGYYLRGIKSWTEIPITGSEIKKRYTVIHLVFPDIVNKIKNNPIKKELALEAPEGMYNTK